MAAGYILPIHKCENALLPGKIFFAFVAAFHPDQTPFNPAHRHVAPGLSVAALSRA